MEIQSISSCFYKESNFNAGEQQSKRRWTAEEETVWSTMGHGLILVFIIIIIIIIIIKKNCRFFYFF
jgi:uncharacterized membrane protein YidH (DUF202 family)